VCLLISSGFADFVPGTLTAILGGSGAGKSSLLAALIGDLPFDGRVMIDGRDVREYRSLFRDKVGFVPQQESLFEAMTVRENVQLAADLRLGGLCECRAVFLFRVLKWEEAGSTTRRERSHRVDAVIRDLQLWQVRHSRVTEISGGQRRRTSIAVELVCDPMVLMLDEPTSG
jgi:ABC-type multidrug transport system ATPase subunit